MAELFKFDDRLGIDLPMLTNEWDKYSNTMQQEILLRWETIRGRIPDRIIEIEAKIKVKQRELNEEDDFIKSCLLNAEISELASIINDLWIWYRTNPSISNH